MTSIPWYIRGWAILLHLNVITWVPCLWLLFALLLPITNAMPNVNPGCAFKPLPECSDHVRLSSLLVNLAGLFLLWSMPFLSPLITKVLLEVKKDIHSFIEEHGREALKFQLKTTTYTAVIHFTFLLLLGSLNPTLDGLLGTTLLIALFDLFLFPVFAVLQLVAAADVAIQTLRGQKIYYPKIR